MSSSRPVKYDPLAEVAGVVAGVEGVMCPLETDAVPLECRLLRSSQVDDPAAWSGDVGLGGAASP